MKQARITITVDAVEIDEGLTKEYIASTIQDVVVEAFADEFSWQDDEGLHVQVTWITEDEVGHYGELE